MDPKKELIKEVLKREFEMFQDVKSNARAACQDNFEEFEIMRGSQFESWSIETVASYCNDLENAKNSGRNLMTLKYARMDNLVPCLHEIKSVIETIDKIAQIQLDWQNELKKMYPYFINKGRPITDEERNCSDTSFLTYLKGELETYSDLTLANLHQDIKECLDRGGNMTKKVYESMVTSLGYDSIEDAEESAKKRVQV